MITVDENTDDTQVWSNPQDGGVYTFLPLSTLSPGTQLEADRLRPAPIILTPPLIADMATAGPNPAKILVRARNATPADLAKPKKPKP